MYFLSTQQYLVKYNNARVIQLQQGNLIVESICVHNPLIENLEA